MSKHDVSKYYDFFSQSIPPLTTLFNKDKSYIQVKQICQKIDGTIQPVIVESSAGATFFHDRNEALIQGVPSFLAKVLNSVCGILSIAWGNSR